jgi:hypothetical protein
MIIFRYIQKMFANQGRKTSDAILRGRTGIIERCNSSVLAGVIVLHIALQAESHGCSDLAPLEDDPFGKKNARMRFDSSE